MPIIRREDVMPDDLRPIEGTPPGSGGNVAYSNTGDRAGGGIAGVIGRITDTPGSGGAGGLRTGTDRPATNPGAITGTPGGAGSTPAPAGGGAPGSGSASGAGARAAGFVDGEYQPMNDSVVRQVDQITSANSPLMVRARGIGMEVANERGLANSTLAAQSSEKAALDAAVPIASQEAQQIYGKNLQYMQDQTGLRQSSMQTAAAERAAFANALQAASASYQSTVAAIMSNPELSASARQSAINSAATQRDADFKMVQQIYGVQLETGSSSGGSGGEPMLNWPSTPGAGG